MHKKIKIIRDLLKNSATIPKEKQTMFFRTEPGSYGEHDRFIGVKVPVIRKIAKDFMGLGLDEIQILFQSKINEERFLALVLLTEKYRMGDQNLKNKIFEFYLSNLEHVNNWNLVDASAHLIVGAHLFSGDKTLLLELAVSEDMWIRRVAIVSTWYFIRNNELEWTFKVSGILLNDEQDLIHKAVGWMLRESGKKDEKKLIQFLDKHMLDMPRTMLRYAIEKFPEKKRKEYLVKSR